MQNVDRDFIEPFPTDVGEAFNVHKQRSMQPSRLRIPKSTERPRSASVPC